MDDKAFIGIDPGKSGGMAIIFPGGRVKVTEIRSIGKDLDIYYLRHWLSYETYLDPPTKHKVMVCIEKSQALPGQGVTSMFNYGVTFGILQGLVLGLGYPFALVTPQTWKKQILEGLPHDKLGAVMFCERLFPTISLKVTARSTKPHDGIADALCLAEFCRRKYGSNG